MADSTLNTVELVHWVSELRAGRPDAAEPVLVKIMTQVGRLARAMLEKFPRVGRFVDPDDVIQNSLIRLLAALRDIRPASTREFYALANTLIRRELLDLTRRYYGPHGHGTNLAPVAVGEGGAAPGPPDAELDRLTAFHEAVADLPVEQREVIGLSYYHGWGQGQIAVLFEVSVRTVQRWHADAVAALRAVLADGLPGRPPGA